VQETTITYINDRIDVFKTLNEAVQAGGLANRAQVNHNQKQYQH
jgi:hypothetical protein